MYSDVSQGYDNNHIAQQLFAGGFMSYLRYLCLFAHSGVRLILCCVLFFFVLLLSMLPVSLDCPFLIAHLVFSNIYQINLNTNYIDIVKNDTVVCETINLLFTYIRLITLHP